MAEHEGCPMTSHGGRRVPAALVVGFLGSGKTTLLRRIASRPGGHRLLFLVNEFSAADVDGRIVRMDGGEVIELPGGSIFCRCLVSAFVSALQRLADLASERTVDGLVIEASGMADPRVTRELLQETGLDARYELRRIVAVADARRLVRLSRTLPVLRSQIEAADLVLLNKCDLATPVEVEAAERWIREVRPDADVRRCVRAETDADLLATPPAVPEVRGTLASCRDPAFDAIEFSPADDINLEALAAALRLCAPALLRLKGFVRCGGRPLLVQWDGETFSAEPAPGAPVAPLAAVVRGGTADSVRRQLEAVLRPAAT
ncbi:MAG: GTP-binding protein [Kiritimatiellae bacterium]|nr:GTP-binding protein [Kiritimatiellia bacterium]